jgi:hypothetical protein
VLCIHADALRASANLANVAVQQLLKTHPAPALSYLVNGQALILAYSDATLVIAIVAFLGIPFVLLLRKGKPPATGAATKAPPDWVTSKTTNDHGIGRKQSRSCDRRQPELLCKNRRSTSSDEPRTSPRISLRTSWM